MLSPRRAALLTLLRSLSPHRKAKWASPVRAPDFWRTDANNAQVRPPRLHIASLSSRAPGLVLTRASPQLAFNLNPALPKMTGRREAYPSPQ